METVDPIEIFWEDLLSGDAKRIKHAFFGISLSEQQAVYAHLKRMVSESGWQPEQKISADNALKVLDSFKAQ